MRPDDDKKSAQRKYPPVILPGCTELYQPNRLTNSKYKSFTLLQSRILITLIKELQEAILASMNGKDWKQMGLFPSDEPNLIRVPIRLKDIAKPRQYREVYEAALELAKVSIRLPSSISKEYYSIASLFPRVELPKRVSGNSVIYVDLFKAAASKLIEIDKTGNGSPGYFTKYLYEVAMNAKSKYTYKLYMIIASWKLKGGFRISVNELKLQLGIDPDDYANYKEFKRRVLLPVQKDLEFRSDCWFNCSVTGFEERQGRKVCMLNFKIIVPAPDYVSREKTDHIKYLLTTHFGFQSQDLKEIENVFTMLIDNDSFEKILLKLQDLKTFIYRTNGTPQEVKYIPQYVSKVLKNMV